MTARILAPIAFALGLSGLAGAQTGGPGDSYPPGLFQVAQFHYDATREPKGWDWYLQSREGQAIVGAIAAYFGVNPAYVTVAIGNTPGSEVVGEESNYNILMPIGYAFCGARVSVLSIVPADGERASVVNAFATRKELRVSTWTPVRHSWEGRSWAEGDAQIIGIKPEFLEEFQRKGVCAAIPESGAPVLSCRGRSACEAGGSLGNVNLAGSTTPRLTLKPGF